MILSALKNSDRRGITVLMGCYAAVAFYVIAAFNGTGDAGDSVQHYLIARYAGKHPALFFDHWAKPLYVLLAFPFAQFGFAGIKVFNVLVSLLTIYYTYRVAVVLQLENALVGAVLMICMPLVFALTFSGLTEPLFALFVAVGTYQVVIKQYNWSALIISFLPFVRSEGLIIIGVIAFFFLLWREWKAIFLLAVGHIVYSFAGYFVYGNLLWVFNKIPYARPDSIYGSGELTHFVVQLYYVLGLPVYALMVIGIVSTAVLCVRPVHFFKSELCLLILLGFCAFFTAHTLFWFLGIFNSMGLKRVFVGIAPWMALLALVGFNSLTSVFRNSKPVQTGVTVLLFALVVLFPFSSNPSALRTGDLKLADEQMLAKETAAYLKTLGHEQQRFVYYAPYFGELLNIDPFDTSVRLELTLRNLDSLHAGDIIIWDDWFAPLDGEVAETRLENDTSMVHLRTFKQENETREIVYRVYQKRPNPQLSQPATADTPPKISVTGR